MNRYIKLEAVLDRIAEAYSKHNELVPMWLHIGDIPYADVVEVRHAEDVGYEDSYGWVSKCSLCGAEFREPTHGANYCPNCGARIDGERKEQR